MSYSIARFYASARAPLDATTIDAWQHRLQSRHDGQSRWLARSVDQVGLMALAGQAQLCQWSVFVHLDTSYRFAAPQLAGPQAPGPGAQTIGRWGDNVLSAGETRFAAMVGAVVGAIGATLILVGQLAISAIWLGITLSVGLMTAVYRAAWAGMFGPTPMPVGLVPLVTTPSDGSDSAGPAASRRARDASRMPALQPCPRARPDTFSSSTRDLLKVTGPHLRLSAPQAARLMRPMPPERAALRAAPASSRAQARFAWPGAPAPGDGQLHAPSFDIYPWTEVWAHRPTYAFLGLRGPWDLGTDTALLGPAHLQQMFVLSARAHKSAATQAPTPLASAPRITWLEDMPLEGDYVRVPRTTPDGHPTPSEPVAEPSIGHNVVETLSALWKRLGPEHRRARAESPDALAASAQARRRWPLRLQRSHSEPWSHGASVAWREQQRAAGAQDVFVRILAPTPPKAKTLTGPRLPDEGLETFLQRLREDGHNDSAYAGGAEAFVSMVRSLHAHNQADEAARPPQAPGPLGLHPQFIKDLPRGALYIYPDGVDTAPGDAFEVNQSLAGQWNPALSASVNVKACAPQLSAWLDKLVPLERGLLREDVTFEATQAGLAAACEAVQRSARPGMLLTPTDQKSTEFVMWPDAQDGRVHIVGLVQHGSLMVMSPDGDADDSQTPLYPYRVHVHLSVGARADRSAPRDVMVHEGDWSTVAPW